MRVFFFNQIVATSSVDLSSAPLLDPRLALVDLEHVDGFSLAFVVSGKIPSMAADRAIFSALVVACRRGTSWMRRRKGRVCRRLAAGDGLELLDGIPLDLDRDPLLGTVLGMTSSTRLADRNIRLGPPHALEIKALQPLYRALDPLVAIARIALLLLARSVPVVGKPSRR
jgi:hypothetical protein